MFYILSAFVISVTYVIMQIITGEMGQAAHNSDTDAVIRFLLILTAAMGIRAILAALIALLQGRFLGKAGYNFRINFARFFLRQPFAKFEKTNSGHGLSVFTNDLREAVGGIGYTMSWMIYNLSLFLVIIAYMFYFNWLYTLIFVVAMPVFALVQVAISIPMGKVARKLIAARSNFNSVVNDSLQNIATVIAYNLEDESEDRYIAEYKKYLSATMRWVRLNSTLGLAGMLFASFPLIFLFIASGLAVANGTMLLSEFIVYTSVGVMAASVLMRTCGQ